MKNKILKLGKLLTISLFLSIIFSATTYAASCVWQSTNGTCSGLWANSDCWSCGNIPTSSDTAIFNSSDVADCEINQTVDIQGMQLQSGYTGTVKPPLSGVYSVTLGSGGLLIGDTNAEFDASNFDLTITTSSSSGINLDNGTFTAPGSARTFQSQGGWDVETAATFDPNGGLVELVGTFSSYIDTNNATLDFYKLTVNLGNDSTFMRLGSGTNSPVDVNDTLTLENGILNSRSSGSPIKVYGSLDWDTTFDGGDAYLTIDTTSSPYNLPNNLSSLTDCFYITIGGTNNPTVNTTSSSTFTCLNGLAIDGGTFDNRTQDADFTVSGPMDVNGGSLYTGATDTIVTAATTIDGGTLYVGEDVAGTPTGTITLQNSTTFNGGTLDGSDAASITSSSGFNFTMNSGTFISTPGKFSLVSSWDLYGGTFTHSDGEVEFGGGNTSFRGPSGTTVDFYDLTVNKNSDTATLTVGNAWDVNMGVENTLHLQNGQIDKRAVASRIYANGDITWDSTFDGGNGHLVVNTTSDYNLPSDLSGLSECFYLTVGGTNTTTVNTSSSTGFTCLLALIATDGTFDNRTNDANFTVNGPTTTNSGGTIYTGAGVATFADDVNVYTGGELNIGESNAGSATFQDRMTVNGGTLDATNSASLTSTAGWGVHIDSGELKSTPGTFEVYDDFDWDGGTFTHNNGTLKFGGSSNLNMDVPGTGTFNNLVIERTSDSAIVSMGNATNDTHTYEGDITIIKGVLNTANRVQTYLEGDWTLCPSSANTACSGSSAGDATWTQGTRNLYFTGQCTDPGNPTPATCQVVYGDNDNTFYNLIKQVTSADSIYFESAEEVRVTNQLTLTGVSGGLLDIRATGSTPADLNAESGMTVDYVRVRNVDNVRAAGDYDLSSTSKGHTENIDLGQNNQGWTFDNPYVETAIPEFSTWLLILVMLGGMGMIANKQGAFELIKK